MPTVEEVKDNIKRRGFRDGSAGVLNRNPYDKQRQVLYHACYEQAYVMGKAEFEKREGGEDSKKTMAAS